jgi:hypothetical protein
MTAWYKLESFFTNLIKKWTFWVIVAVCVIVLGILNLAINNDNSSVSNSDDTLQETTYSQKDYKSECESIDYKTLARNPEKYKGNKYKLTGQVVQVQEPTNGDTVELRVDITKNKYGNWENTIYATVEIPKGNDRILEDDVITFWGECEGLYSYSSVLDNKVSLPKINIKYFEIKE